MEKSTFSFFGRRLSAQTAGQCDLTAIVGTDGLSLLATDPSGEVWALQSWQFTEAGRSFREVETSLRKLLGTAELLGFSYGQVRCALSNPNVTLVPRRLYAGLEDATYFKLLLPPEDPYEYLSEPLAEFDCQVLNAVEAPLLQLARQYVHATRPIPLALPLLQQLRTGNNRAGYEVIANVRHSMVQVAVLERQNLLFYNSFLYQQPADLLYCVLLAYDQFRLQPADIGLSATGILLENSEEYRLLYRYFRDIRFLPRPGNARWPSEAPPLPAHAFYDLFSLKNLS